MRPKKKILRTGNDLVRKGNAEELYASSNERLRASHCRYPVFDNIYFAIDKPGCDCHSRQPRWSERRIERSYSGDADRRKHWSNARRSAKKSLTIRRRYLGVQTR